MKTNDFISDAFETHESQMMLKGRGQSYESYHILYESHDVGCGSYNNIFSQNEL